jgi:hypothetical protein
MFVMGTLPLLTRKPLTLNSSEGATNTENDLMTGATQREAHLLPACNTGAVSANPPC